MDPRLTWAPIAPPRACTARAAGSSLAAFALVLFVVFPLCNLVIPEGNPFHMSAYWVSLVGKIMCYAIVALAMDLIWGYAGILSLGHGLFFALGGYAFGMYLMRQIGADGQYRVNMPDFMVFLDWKEFPWQWWNTDQFWWCALLVVLVPGLLAFVFGFFAFRSRIKGVYFSIITQALTFAAMLLFFRNATGFGGNNGFTDFKRILGIPITTPQTRMALFAITGATLIGTLLLGRYIVTSKFGRVLTAIRDAEARVMFCGYNPVHYKLAIWTLSAVLCGIAGALYVPQVGIINPSEMSPANSIEIAIWVAVGGRGTLVGAIVGAFVVNGAKSFFTQAFPEYWLFVLGLIFILVTLFLPKGVVGLWSQWKNRLGVGATESERPSIEAAAEWSHARHRARPAGLRARRHPVPGRHQRQLRRLQGAEQALAHHRRRRAALHHRPERRRQDHHDGRDHRQDPAGQRDRVLRPDHRPAADDRSPRSRTPGVGRKFQKPTIFEQHTVFENLELAMKADKRVRATLFARLTDDERDRIAETLRLIRLDDAADRVAGLLSHGQKQWLEIGMLLMQEPKLLLLDEPVAGMTDDETERTAELFLSLAGKHSLVVVEHDMAFRRQHRAQGDGAARGQRAGRRGPWTRCRTTRA